MTGGNQVKLATLIVGTPLGAAILAAHRRGALVAGTSAGRQHPVRAHGVVRQRRRDARSSGSARSRRVSACSTDVIVDQHFTQRNRFGRLLALIASNPAQLGIGVDEDTAAIIRPSGLMEVKGRGVVTVVDGAEIVTTSYTATGTQPLMMSGVKLHTLPRGAVFDLVTRRLVSAPGLPDTAEVPAVAVPADVPAGSRPRSRRIAAEGAHETTSELRRRPAST